jgi:hypothetical protein
MLCTLHNYKRVKESDWTTTTTLFAHASRRRFFFSSESEEEKKKMFSFEWQKKGKRKWLLNVHTTLMTYPHSTYIYIYKDRVAEKSTHSWCWLSSFFLCLLSTHCFSISITQRYFRFYFYLQRFASFDAIINGIRHSIELVLSIRAIYFLSTHTHIKYSGEEEKKKERSMIKTNTEMSYQLFIDIVPVHYWT